MSEIIFDNQVREVGQLDTESPFYDYVVAALLPNTGSGDDLVNLATGETITSVNAITWNSDGSITSTSIAAKAKFDDSTIKDWRTTEGDLLMMFDYDMGISQTEANTSEFFSLDTDNKSKLYINHGKSNTGGITFGATFNSTSNSITTNVPAFSGRSTYVMLLSGTTDEMVVYKDGIEIFRQSFSPWESGHNLQLELGVGQPSGKFYSSQLLRSSPDGFTDEEVATLVENPYQLFKTQDIVNQEYCLVFDSASQTVTFPLTGAWTGTLTYDDNTTSAESGTGAFVLDGTTPIKVKSFTATDTVESFYYEMNQTRGDTIRCAYTSTIAQLVGFPADGGYVRKWGVSDGLELDGISNYVAIDIAHQSGNTNPTWNLKFQITEDNNQSGDWYRCFTDVLGSGFDNRFIIKSDGTEIRFSRSDNERIWSALNFNPFDIIELDMNGATHDLELFVNGVSQGVKNNGFGVGIDLNICGENAGVFGGFKLKFIDFTTPDDSTLERYYDCTAIKGNSLIVPETINGNDGTLVGFDTSTIFVPEQNKTLVSGSEATGDAVYSYENYGEIAGYQFDASGSVSLSAPSTSLSYIDKFYIEIKCPFLNNDRGYYFKIDGVNGLWLKIRFNGSLECRVKGVWVTIAGNVVSPDIKTTRITVNTTTGTVTTLVNGELFNEMTNTNFVGLDINGGAFSISKQGADSGCEGVFSYININGQNYYDFTSGDDTKIIDTVSGNHATITNASTLKWQPVISKEIITVGSDGWQDYGAIGGALDNNVDLGRDTLREIVVYNISDYVPEINYDGTITNIEVRGAEPWTDRSAPPIYGVYKSSGTVLNIGANGGASRAYPIKFKDLSFITEAENTAITGCITYARYHSGTHLQFEDCYIKNGAGDCFVHSSNWGTSNNLTIDSSVIVHSDSVLDWNTDGLGNIYIEINDSIIATEVDADVAEFSFDANTRTLNLVNNVFYRKYTSQWAGIGASGVTGSNNVDNWNRCATLGIGTNDSNLSTYFNDAANGDYTINETGQTALTGNGSDLVSWAWFVGEPPVTAFSISWSLHTNILLE